MTSPPVASKPAQACLLLVDTPRPPQKEAASPEPDNIAHLYQLCKGNSIKVSPLYQLGFAFDFWTR